MPNLLNSYIFFSDSGYDPIYIPVFSILLKIKSDLKFPSAFSIEPLTIQH